MTITKKKPVSFSRQLRRLGACDEAVEWVGKKSAATAWKQCPRYDWLCWMLDRGYVPRGKMRGLLLDLMAFALDAARGVAGKEAYWPPVEESHRLVREALQGRGDLAAAEAAAEAAAWAAARTAAGAAAWAAARTAAGAAAWAAAEAAAGAAARTAAGAAAWAAAWAAAGDAAEAAAGAAARTTVCGIIRKHFPKPPRLARAKP